jgi:hypothetical protein
MAAAKREVTEKEPGTFMKKLERCLKTNEDMGTPCVENQLEEDVPGFFKEGEQVTESPYSAHVAVLRICST